MSSMLTNTKILVGVLTIIIAIQHVGSSKVLTLSGESEDENNLKQALYLVKLLKTDYMKSLRANGEIEPISDEANSTCPDEDGLNSTTPLNINTTPVSNPRMVTLSLATVLPSVMVPSPVAPNPIMAGQPPPPPFQPVPPMGPPLAAMTPPPILQNMPPGNMPPAENFKYPYRFYRRRMMPEYYYYDVLMPRYRSHLDGAHPQSAVNIARGISAGNNIQNTTLAPFIDEKTLETTETSQNTEWPIPGFRRAGGDLDPIVNRTNQTAIETSSTPLSATIVSEATSIITTTSATAPSAHVSESSTLMLQAAENQNVTSPVVTQSTDTIPTSTSSSLPPTVMTTRAHINIIHTKRGHAKTSPVTKIRSKHVKKMKKINYNHLRTTRHKEPVSEDVVLSQVASELLHEFKGTRNNNISVVLRNSVNRHVPKPKAVTHKSTMKIYLQGSSRIQIPFPENNAFCHLYPQSKLCGAGI